MVLVLTRAILAPQIGTQILIRKTARGYLDSGESFHSSRSAGIPSISVGRTRALANTAIPAVYTGIELRSYISWMWGTSRTV